MRIEHKYVFRWQQCAEDFETRFPDRRDLQSFKMGDEDLPLQERFSAMFKAIELRAAHIDEVMTAYQESPLTLHALAEAIGTDLVSCLLSLALDENCRVRACLDNEARHRRFVEIAECTQSLILSPASLGTLLALGIETEVFEWSWTIQLTHSTRELLMAFIRRHTDPRQMGTFGKVAGNYFFEDRDAEQAKVLAERAQTLIDRSEVIPTLPLAQMDNDQRTTIVQLHGQGGAEALAATIDNDAIAWGDDAIYAFTADHFGGQVAGAQSFIEAAVTRQAITRERANELIAQLLGLQYEITWFTPAVTRTAARMAEFNPGKPPFSALMRLLGQDGRASSQIIDMALTCIYDVAHNLELDVSRNTAITVILEAISSRQNGALIIEQVQRAIPARFGLSAIRGSEARRIIRDFVSSHETRRIGQ